MTSYQTGHKEPFSDVKGIVEGVVLAEELKDADEAAINYFQVYFRLQIGADFDEYAIV